MALPVHIPKGTQFGFFTTIGHTPIGIKGNNHWEVRCICGAIRLCKGSNLRLGKSKSCGCSAGDTISLKAIVRLNPDTRKPSGPRKPRGTATPLDPPALPPPPPLSPLTPELRLAQAMRRSGAKWNEVLEVTGLTQAQLRPAA
jgi:hypothetical protein